MKALVTGIAGFVGSHLGERLVRDGWDVRGVDNLSAYYDRRLKERNLSLVRQAGPVEVRTLDLRTADVHELLDGVDVVFHFAAQPGVRASWEDFGSYLSNNMAATQRLLGGAAGTSLQRFVFASSSSVYGQVTSVVDEESPTRPFSPYGVTKLAGEALCAAYQDNFGVPTVSLRLFTVYGPRQRPDMAFHRLIKAALLDRPFDVFGDGSQVRSFTYVGDVVDAALLSAGASSATGRCVNIAGGSAVSLSEAILAVGQALGRPVRVRYTEQQPGDVHRTGADAALAEEMLGWRPLTALQQGLDQQIDQMHEALNLMRGLPATS